jgi:predicted ribosome-associated RNA-binding protein Tma20
MRGPRHRVRTTPEDRRLLVRRLEMELADAKRARGECVERLIHLGDAIVSLHKRLAEAREGTR